MNGERPLFIRLRGAYFTELGYTLNAMESAPRGLTAKASGSFVLRKGTEVQRMTTVPGTAEACPDHALIHLQPYPDANAALGALAGMCMLLPRALDGQRNAKLALGTWWKLMLQKGLALKYAKPDLAHQIVRHFFGKGRTADALNTHGTLAALDEGYDLLQLVSEALQPLQRGELQGLTLIGCEN